MSLFLSRQAPLGDFAIELDGCTPSEFIKRIAHSDSFISHLQRGVLAAASLLPAGVPSHHTRHVLRDAGVTALDGAYADVLAEFLDQSRSSEAVIDVTAAFGDETPGPLGVHQPFEEFLNGPLAVLANMDESPVVTVTLSDEFRTQRRSQRDKICRILTALANIGDVTIVGTHLQLHWFAESHRKDLPSVQDERDARGIARDTEEVVKRAANELSIDDRRNRVLELLAEDDSQTLSYDTVDGQLTVARETLRGYVRDLKQLELVRVFGPQSDRCVELTAAGQQFVDDEIARQRRLSETVLNCRKSSGDSRVSRARSGGGEAQANAASTGRLGRSTHEATVGVGVSRGITLAQSSVVPWEKGDRGWSEPRLSVDDDQAEAVVGVEPQGPLSLVVSIALALWDPPARERLWTDSRMNRLDNPLSENKTVLRGIRTIGWIDDDIESGIDFRAAMAEAATELRELTTKLGNDAYADRDSFRGEIMRHAHGMIGVAAQVADLVDVDLYYYIQLPEWQRNWGDSRRRSLAETIAKMCSIQSQYQGHTGYRQLFESRKKKREQSFSVNVDPADPVGSLLSSFVLVGNQIANFQSDLEKALQRREEHDNAPGFRIDVPISAGYTADDWRSVLRRVGSLKRLTIPRQAIQTAQALCESPFDIAAGIMRSLSKEHRPRELRSDELVRALQTLPVDRILSNQYPSVRKIVHTLLHANEPISESVLLETANVSQRSLRSHQDLLTEFGLIAQSERGWKIQLSLTHDTPEEWPAPSTQCWSVFDGLYALAQGTLPVDHLSGGHWITNTLHQSQSPPIDQLRGQWRAFDHSYSLIVAFAGRPTDRSLSVASLGSTIQSNIAKYTEMNKSKTA